MGKNCAGNDRTGTRTHLALHRQARLPPVTGGMLEGAEVFNRVSVVVRLQKAPIVLGGQIFGGSRWSRST
jgi:hypothetical protein